MGEALTAELLGRRINELSLEVPKDSDSRLASYVETLARWNQRIRLVGPSAEEEIARDHVGDCLAVVAHIENRPLRVLDVGSGAGLPAIVIAICRPEAHVVALEPIHKKHSFLRAAKRELGLDNLETHALRFDDYLRRNEPLADVAISRATWALDEWLKRAVAATSKGGLILGMEGEKATLEAAAKRFPYPLGNRTRAIISLRIDDLED